MKIFIIMHSFDESIQLDSFRNYKDAKQHLINIENDYKDHYNLSFESLNGGDMLHNHLDNITIEIVESDLL